MNSYSDTNLLLQHGGMLIKHAQVIFETPEYAFAPVKDAKFGSSMVVGGELTLGTLMLLWGYIPSQQLILPNGQQAPIWRAKTASGNDAHFFYIAGSLSSGGNSWSGLVFETQEIVTGKVNNFGWYFGAGLCALRSLANCTTKQEKFVSLQDVIAHLT